MMATQKHKPIHTACQLSARCVEYMVTVLEYTIVPFILAGVVHIVMNSKVKCCIAQVESNQNHDNHILHTPVISNDCPSLFCEAH